MALLHSQTQMRAGSQTTGSSNKGRCKKKDSIFKDIIQIEVALPPSHPIFDKFIFDKVLIMLTSLPPLEFLTKIVTF